MNWLSGDAWGGARPPIVLCVSDRDALLRQAFGVMLRSPRQAGALLDEVLRARVVPDGTLGADVARLGSTVTYLDHGSGEQRTARLVMADAEGPGELSVSASAGAALIGLSRGQSIVWDERVGLRRRLTVLAVDGAPPVDSSPD
jgi:regulator of nucleoside diphosphate kinase